MSNDPQKEYGYDLVAFLNNKPVDQYDYLGLWSLEFRGSWGLEEIRVRWAFDKFKVYLPAMIDRAKVWRTAVRGLSDCCACKRHFLQDINNLIIILENVRADVRSSKQMRFIKVYFVGADIEAQVHMLWPYGFFGAMYVDASTIDTWGEVQMRRIIFHELLHIVEVDDTSTTKYVSDSSFKYKYLPDNPYTYSLAPWVTIYEGWGISTEGCPKGGEWYPP